MSRKSKGTIFVNTFSQKALLENELMGQFSDGRWENSRNNSWEFYSNCDVEITDGELGYTKAEGVFEHPKAYNCNDRELLSYVGSRMLGNARFSNYFQCAVSYNDQYLLDLIVGSDDTDLYPQVTESHIEHTRERLSRNSKQENNEFWSEKVKDFDVFVGKFTTLEILTALNDTSYTKKDLRKDLREITKSLKNELETA